MVPVPVPVGVSRDEAPVVELATLAGWKLAVTDSWPLTPGPSEMTVVLKARDVPALAQKSV